MKNIIFIALFTTALLHLSFYLNPRYSIFYNGERMLSGANEDMYYAYLRGITNWIYKDKLVAGTQIWYFNKFPDWSINIFYPLYWVIGIWYFLYDIKRKKEEESKVSA